MQRLTIIKNHLSQNIEVCIVAVGRSPIKPFLRDFSGISNAELAGQTIQGLLCRFNIPGSSIEECYLGKVFTSGIGQALPKQILARAGLPDHISGMSVNKLCASSMKAVTLAALSIASGNSQCAIAGGVECMSQIPYLLQLRKGINAKVKDSLNHDGFPDAVTQEFPIQIADIFSRDQGYTKETVDEFARKSCEKAQIATKLGKFRDEIIEIRDPRTGKVFASDEIKERTAVDNSKAVLKEGVNSAGNSCGINDGAAFVVLCSRKNAVEEGWKVLASVAAFADSEQHARLFPSTPALAIQKALKIAGITVKDVDYMEINEPFGCVPLENARILGFDVGKINVYGGVIALGHPVGSSGCRIVGTLVNVLRQEGGKYGVASICNAGGGGTAIVIKKE